MQLPIPQWLRCLIVPPETLHCTCCSISGSTTSASSSHYKVTVTALGPGWLIKSLISEDILGERRGRGSMFQTVVVGMTDLKRPKAGTGPAILVEHDRDSPA